MAGGSDNGDPPEMPKGLSAADLAQIIEALQKSGVIGDTRTQDKEKEKDGKRYWKTTDVGYFWPDMPSQYGAGRVIDYDGTRYFRDANAFVAQVRDSVAYYTAEVVRNNLHNCLKGQAFIWYSDIVPQSTKKALRNDTSAECTHWTDVIIENFKQSGAQAMDRIASEHTRYTMQMLKSGVSLVSWFTDMISLATDAEFNDDQKLRFVWYKMDAELRERVPVLTGTHTISSYLNALRKSEEGIREAVRAQDRRLSTQLRPNDWRFPNRRPPGNFAPRTSQPQTYPPTADSEAGPSTQTPRGFQQYVPDAFRRDTQNLEDKGKSKEVVKFTGTSTKPGWATGPLAARKDSFRVSPKRGCRHCGGNHYDSMCNRRIARTPRVYCYETDEAPIYKVEATFDTEYDIEHQEFITSYFASGHSMDDFYRLCDDGFDFDPHDIVDCGLAEAAGEQTHIPTVKSPPTTAVYNANAVHQPTRFHDTTMRVPTPKSSSKDWATVKIHHVDDATAPQHQCARCPAKFRHRNKLYKHLRTTNHYMATDVSATVVSATDVSATDVSATDVAATPNDPTQEHEPDVVKSKAPAVFGTGYGFRTFNYLEMQVRLDRHGPDTWVCLDTGAGMSLIDRKWLQELCPDAAILTRASGVSVRGIDNKAQQTSTYVVLQLYMPAYDPSNGSSKIAEIRREFHIVSDLRCKLIIGEDVIEPEGFVIDSQARKASIKSCDNLNVKLRITPKGRQVMHRRVRTLNRVTVKPGSKASVPIKCKPLPSNRDYEFTPVYDAHTAYLAEVGGFLRAVIDDRTDCLIFHNRSQQPIVIQKDLNIGYVADFTVDTYHGCAEFDPDEHPCLMDAAENGTWKKGLVTAAAVSLLACTTASRKVNSSDIDIANDTSVQAVFNPWHAHPPHQTGGEATRVSFGSTIDTLADSIYQMTQEAADQQYDTPVGKVDINSNDEIRPQQTAALRRVAVRFSNLFEDRGTVAIEPEEDYMKITLKPGASLPNRGPYNNSSKDRAVIDDKFDGYHKQGKMDWAPQGVTAASPAFVVWQKEVGRVVMDIRGLNAAVNKDPYPMPRQEDILQSIKGCTWISTLDLTAAFMQRALHRDSQHLVTVVTHRGLEYFKVAPFGFTNSPAHMQRFMDKKLRHMRNYVRCYVDDIVVHSKTFDDHLRHLQEVFQTLHDTGLYLSPTKCHLGYHSVKLLGRLVDRLGLSTLKERADAIQKLDFPKTLQQLESFIGSANYCRNHVPYYAALVAPLEQLKRDLLRPAPRKGRHRKHFSAKCSLDNPTDKQLASFQALKDALAGPNTLIHFDGAIPLVIRMDAAKERGYGAMVTQIPVWSFSDSKRAATVLDPTAPDYDHTLERPICYLSKRLNKHEKNYWPTELEVAGLVWTVRKLRHLIDDAAQVVVFTDHQATKDIAVQTNFRHSAPHRQNLRLVRASLYLSQFPHIKVHHIPGRLNVVPDALSRLQAIDDETLVPDEEQDIYDALQLQTSMLRISDDLIDQFQRGYNEDPFYKTRFAEMKRQFAKQGSLPVEYNNMVLEDAEINAFTPPAEQPVTLNARRYLLYLKDGDRLRLCVPRTLYAPFLEMAHDRHNHAGVDRVYQKLRPSYFIKGASRVIRDYVQHCPACLINKPNNYTPSGKLIPISAPASPWELVTMDFVVKLPPSTPKTGLWSQLVGKPNLPTYDSFLTITDKLTKYVMIVPGCEKWDAAQWAQAYFDSVFPIFGVPAAIISDRGSVFVSLFWTTVFKLMKTDCIATTAYNPRSDGQSERTNQVVEIALRSLVNDCQDDWPKYLGEVQFAMNNSTNASTGKVPSELLMAYTPRSAIDVPTGHLSTQGAATQGTAKQAHKRVEQLALLREEAQDAIKLAEFTMASTYDKNHRIADIRAGDYVFINFAKKVENGYTASGVQCRKLGPQRAGPFRVIAMIGENACQVDIPSDWKIWPIVSVRHLTKAPSTPDTFKRPAMQRNMRPEVVHDVEDVLDVRMMKGRKEYFVKYVGLPLSRCEWVSPEHMERARDKIEAFDSSTAAKASGLLTKRKRKDDTVGARKKR
jgi:hypothetical protein